MFRRLESVRYAAGVFTGVCLLMLGALLFVKAQTKNPLIGNPAVGKNLFINKGCIKCHAMWGIGGKIGPDLSRLGAGESAMEIAATLWNHSPAMGAMMKSHGIARPSFTSQEMGDLISYLYYLNYSNNGGDPERGKAIFSRKGCSYCHAIGGMGGHVGPRLDDRDRYGSPLGVAQAMWNHGRQMETVMRKFGVKNPYFQQGEMTDLLAFIRAPAPVETLAREFTLPGNSRIGRQLFHSKSCGKCHSIRGVGGKLGPDLARKEANQSVTEVAGKMWNHSSAMRTMMGQLSIAPPVFRGSEMGDLLAYVYLAGYEDLPGNPSAGKSMFSQKGCVNCHTVGNGPSIGPDLAASAAILSHTNLMAAMWNHAPTMLEKVREKGMTWPTFQPAEMRDLVEYLKSASPHSRQRDQ